MQQLISEDPQQFFKHVNYTKKQSNDLPRTMKLNDKTANNPKEVAELFRTFFNSVYVPHDEHAITNFEIKSKHTDKIKNICANIPPIEIDEKVIEEAIKNLPNNLVAGPDNIPNIFIKNCLESLITPITNILKSSLNEAEVPVIWKQSFVRPIFKNGNKSDIKNYRGVAIQCTIPKLLDSIIAHHLNKYIKNIITDHQHGFIMGKSTVTNLMEFTSVLSTGIKLLTDQNRCDKYFRSNQCIIRGRTRISNRCNTIYPIHV